MLDKVKTLATAPDGEHATIEMVADYYEVDVDAIESVVRRHRAELVDNGLHVLRGAALRKFDSVGREEACAGWLATMGADHIGVRLAVISGQIPGEALTPGAGWPDLFDTYDEMAGTQAGD